MSSVVEFGRSWPLPRVLAVAVIAASAAACSSEVTRFDSNPFAAQNQATGSIPQQRVPTGQVQTSSLPPPAGSQQAAAPSPTMSASLPPSGYSGGGRGMASYQPAYSPSSTVTGTVQAPPARSPHSLPPPVSQAASKGASKAASKPAPKAASGHTTVHVVVPGETLIRIARRHNMSLPELARLNNVPAHTRLNIGDRITVPATRTSRTARLETPKVAPSKAPSAPAKSTATEAKSVPKSQPRPTAAASRQLTETASVATPANDPPTTSGARSGHARLSFRWPAKGRIIAGFGPKTNGQTNDGINIALPEGTAVKAAEDGVVAYAGSELKGYGNLVLVRHADGYVTAYAHAKELLVKRGDSIKRGQTIARSGQTGNVDAPQLHFEIRKGPSPIDPMPQLRGG